MKENLYNYRKEKLFVSLSIGVLGILTFILFGCSSKNDQNPDSTETRESITKGRKVKSTAELGKTVVAIVSSMQKGQALCTGTIISENLILTAAHCVDDTPSSVQIIFSTNVKQASADTIRSATGVYQNPYWTHPNSDKQGDLALIEFSGGIPEGYFAVQLVSKTFELAEGQDVLFLGYGVTGGRQKGSGVLRMTETTIIGQQSPTQVITDGRATSVCFGDSGGPAFASVNNQYLQWGVASSVSSSSCNESSIHTAVMEYLPWIRGAIRSLAQGEIRKKIEEQPE